MFSKKVKGIINVFYEDDNCEDDDDDDDDEDDEDEDLDQE